MNQPDKDTEIEELKREIRELKEKDQTFESDQNAFKKHKKRFSVNILTLILKLLMKLYKKPRARKQDRIKKGKISKKIWKWTKNYSS